MNTPRNPSWTYRASPEMAHVIRKIAEVTNMPICSILEHGLVSLLNDPNSVVMALFRERGGMEAKGE